ncbi:ABC transporter G family member 20 [Galendromus occidentalis]|uniref:ABC transporter G family member 20 n=1 Tax=Galendromus occidentalis TaxID=34638 RepID=A0AAJ7SHI8_9ACAR|nr:ABC transporter G family member 20 [Galendromus occidentalis]
MSDAVLAPEAPLFSISHGSCEARVGHVNVAFDEPSNASSQEGGTSYPVELSPDPDPIDPAQKLAVEVNRVRFTYEYGNQEMEVLKGINLSVPAGKIYGLLGPSGCGKTTLLKCIVGRKTPHAGMVRVFDEVPATPGALIPGPGVGYMPQESALYREETIHGNLHHFGQLIGMPEELIQKRIQFLLDFLDLPKIKKKVGKLSGGQQRRVSLAVALIHEPPLLILDEPTVGVDPLLRQAIWKYLVTLTRDRGMTVIVTTHYVEEARQADVVGLMRSGRMLAEDSPERLLEDFHCETLEDVFLQLCLADKEERAITDPREMPEVIGEKNDDDTVASMEVQEEVSDPYPPRQAQTAFEAVKRHREALWEASSRERIVALVRKNIIRLRSSKPYLLFTFLIPSFVTLLFCLCIGADPYELPVAVVNSDRNPVHSNAFLKTLPRHTIVQRLYSNLDLALASVARGETWGSIHIRQDYSRELKYRFISGIDADNKTLEASTIDVYMDMTNLQIGFILQKTILESFRTFCEDLLREMDKNVNLAQLPIQIKEPVHGDRKSNATARTFMTPGIILAIMYIMAVPLTAISIIMENREGTTDRCWAAGVKPLEVIVSLVVSQSCIVCVQLVLLFALVFIGFQTPLEGSLTLVVLLTFLQGTTGMIYGLLISSICAEEQSAMMLAVGTFFPNLLMSGVIWPIQSMPRVVRAVAYGLPQTIPIESLRCIMYRGWGIDKFEVWSGFVISIGWAILLLLFTLAASRARK